MAYGKIIYMQIPKGGFVSINDSQDKPITRLADAIKRTESTKQGVEPQEDIYVPHEGTL